MIHQQVAGSNGWIYTLVSSFSASPWHQQGNLYHIDLYRIPSLACLFVRIKLAGNIFFHSEAHNSRYLFMYECNRISLKLNSTHLTQLKAIRRTKCNMLRRRGKPPARILGVLGHCQFRGWGPKYAQTSLTRYRKLFLKKVHLTAMSLILFNWWCGNGSKPIPRNLQIPERGFTLCFTRCSFF